MIEVDDYDPFAQSDNMHYNCLDFAVDSRLKSNADTMALEHYLTNIGLALTRPA